jgi:hypothetical protein
MFISSETPGQSGMKYDLAEYITPETLSKMCGERIDAAGTAFFLRDLTDVYSRTFDVKYGNLKARQILPFYSGVDAGAEGYVWRQYDKRGAANIVTDYASDFPNVDVVGLEVQARCYSLGASYQYSIMDLRKAAKAGVPLEARRAMMAREAIENAIEQIAFFGVKQSPGSTGQSIVNAPPTINTNDQVGTYGMTNFPGLTVDMLTNDWTQPSTSVATMLSDFNKEQLQVVVGSLGVHSPDTLVLPLSMYARLSTTARSVAFTDDTILQYMQKQSPWLKNVFFTPMLETAGLKQDTVTPGVRALLFERNEENIQFVMPQEFEQFPPQPINMTFKVPCHARVGGVRVSYPKAFRAFDGFAG